jgi:hypothetical protein
MLTARASAPNRQRRLPAGERLREGSRDDRREPSAAPVHFAGTRDSAVFPACRGDIRSVTDRRFRVATGDAPGLSAAAVATGWSVPLGAGIDYRASPCPRSI